MKTPSPALAVATLALAVALTGTANATGLINGRSIKDHSIPASKLMLHSVTAKQIKTHAITKTTLADGVTVDPTTGPAGPKGDAGPPGPAGLLDPSKLVVVAGADVSLYASSEGDAVATCPAGTFLLGGGFSDMGTAQKVYAVSSAPSADRTTWTVHARNESTLSQSQPWHAIAYCVVSP